MLKPQVGEPRVFGGSRQSFAIVASQYNALYVQGLIDNATQEFLRLAPAARVGLHQVPGAFEIPLAAQELILQPGGEIDVVIAVGVILQGDTDHAEHIARSVTDALQQVSLATRTPIIHQVLSCKSEEQARIRCLEPEFNRGIEAARAAISMFNLLSQLRAS
jgi:6,7-dimethyl-8-ribityllumazine synthase